jgi:flagellar biosynthesis/type III secretory pathway protein FliH
MKDFVPLVPPGNAATWKRNAEAANAEVTRAFQRALLPAGAFAGGFGAAPSQADDPEPSVTDEPHAGGAPEDDSPEAAEAAFQTAVRLPDPELLARIDELEARDAARREQHEEAMQSLVAREKEMAEAPARLPAAAQGLDAARQAVITEIREGVGPVILEAARRIAGDQLHVDTRLLDAVVEEAVRALGRDGLLVRVAPVDLKLVRSRLQPLGIEVVEDPRISGGVICEGPTGRIDASLEAASEAIRAVLEQWRAAP